MKTESIFIALCSALIFFAGCEKDSSKDPKGTLEIRCFNPLTSNTKSDVKMLKSVFLNPPLVGDTTETIMTGIKLGFGDVWVSQDEVKAGEPDNLEWVRLTQTTNTEIKLFEDYAFPAVEIPAGTYKSIKISLRTVSYRIVQLTSNPSITYEILETNKGGYESCDPNDESWAKTNYFSADGNHNLDNDGVFKLAASGEKVGGFTIESGKKAILTWRFGAGAAETCTNYLIDKNGNREWDCGTDDIDIECPPSIQYMWDFVVDYE